MTMHALNYYIFGKKVTLFFCLRFVEKNVNTLFQVIYLSHLVPV